MEQARFGEMVTQYERLVYTICYQLCRDHHIAEDLAQETFLAAYRHIDAAPEDNLKPWLARIATNKAKDHLKSAYNRKVTAAANDTLPEDKPVLFMQEESPEALAIEKDMVARIEEDIRSLKEPYQMVSVLFFIEENSVEEISQKLQRPTKTVHTQLYRARRLLQEKLKGGG